MPGELGKSNNTCVRTSVQGDNLLAMVVFISLRGISHIPRHERLTETRVLF